MMQSKKLSRFKEIVHGFTTRDEGDFRTIKNRENSSIIQNDSLAKIGLTKQNLVLGNQIHSDHCFGAKRSDGGKMIKATDGLMTKENKLVLGICTADCCPILFYEPKARIAAAVHAGWRGTLLGIAGKMVREIGEMGGIRGKIICVIGPHICNKCYDIPQERAKLFSEKAIKRRGREFYLDLTLTNMEQLIKFGINKQNIEVLPFCTVCQNRQFFSYRKNQGRENYGEMLAYIGLI